MNNSKSIQSRRIGVLVNIKSLIAFVLLFEFIRIGILPTKALYFELIPFALIIVSYIIFFGKTGTWKFAHKPLRLLDEREVQVLNQSLRFSYILFTLFSLSLFIIYNVLDLKINMVVVASLIYLAHILPCYYVNWTEKQDLSKE